MADWGDVLEASRGLPQVARTETFGAPALQVDGEPFVWIRVLQGADLDRLGAAAPDGEVVAFALEMEGEKWPLIREQPEVFFSLGGSEGSDVVFANLDELDPAQVEDLVVAAWSARAPEELADRVSAERPRRSTEPAEERDLGIW